jgi:hypothetical protein
LIRFGTILNGLSQMGKSHDALLKRPQGLALRCFYQHSATSDAVPLLVRTPVWSIDKLPHVTSGIDGLGWAVIT